MILADWATNIKRPKWCTNYLWSLLWMFHCNDSISMHMMFVGLKLFVYARNLSLGWGGACRIRMHHLNPMSISHILSCSFYLLLVDPCSLNRFNDLHRRSNFWVCTTRSLGSTKIWEWFAEKLWYIWYSSEPLNNLRYKHFIKYLI